MLWTHYIFQEANSLPRRPFLSLCTSSPFPQDSDAQWSRQLEASLQTAAKRGAPVLADVRFSAESHASLFPATRGSTPGSSALLPKAGSKGTSKGKSKTRKSSSRRGASSFCVPLPMYARPVPHESGESRSNSSSSSRSRSGSATAQSNSKSSAHTSVIARNGPSRGNSRSNLVSGQQQQQQPFPALGAFLMSRDSLLGGTVMHAIALHGSSSLARWACSDPKLVALLEARDALGLTPLAAAAKALANLLRPQFAPPPPPLDSSRSSPSASGNEGLQRAQGSDSVLADACRLHGVLYVLRSACGAETAIRHHDTRSALSGLALCIAYGSPSLEKEAACLDPFGLLGRDDADPQGRTRLDSTSSSSLSSVAPSPAGTPANAAAAKAALALTNAALGITTPHEGREMDNSYHKKDHFDTLDHSGDRDGLAQRPSSTASSHSSSSGGSHGLHSHMPAESVLQHLFLYSIIAGYEARIHPKTGLLVLSDYHNLGSSKSSGSSGGKVPTSGVVHGVEWWTGRDRFHTLAAYTACGWALHGAVGLRVEVPMTQPGVQLLLAPLQKSTTLQHLDLSRLGFGGKLPSGIGLIPSLTYIDLFENQLTGSLPGLELGALPNLRGLNLASNALCGDVPSSMFQPDNLPSKLWLLSLHTNLLGGVLPSSLWQCRRLKELWLGHNSLRGPLPDAVGGLVSLQTLVLAANDLGGPLPDGLSKLQALRGLYLQENRLTGALPRGLFELTSLTSLSVRGNKLTGTLPSALGNMVSLQRLHLGHNQFTGTLPESLGHLSALRHLYLNHNQFTGEVPCDALASPPNISTVCLIGNDGLTHRGRASKTIARLICHRAFARTNAATGAPTKGNPEQTATAAGVAAAAAADPLNAHPLRKRGRINVQVLTIDPLAVYTDDAENWRV